MSIAVVLAVRDQASYLGEALDSIFAQSLPADEIVLVDDGSSDGTGDVGRERGVKVLRTEGITPGPARNLGVAATSSDLICVLDGDDRFLPCHNEALVAAIGGAEAARGYVREFFDAGREDELAARFRISDRPQPGGVVGAYVIRRSAIDRIGGFPVGGAHDFFGLVHALGECPTTPEVVVERRIHGANRTVTDREGYHREFLVSARRAILARREEQA